MIALVGILALTLDFGFLLLARRQMQTGVNAAALEGLRNFDGNGREHARDLMRNIYDDDLDPDQNETTIGAGIDKSLIQGDGNRSVTIGDGSGLRNILANRSQYIYRPRPELNLNNEVHGDFVRGDFDPSREHGELHTYQRDDFEPSPTGNAFLARLRRTHNPNSLDQDPGISSSGGCLPLIIRRDGVTVRATAIAQEHLAVRVWQTTDPKLYSPLPLGISVSNLQSGNVSATQSLAIPLTTVGQSAVLLGANTPTQSGYIAVVDTSPGSDRVVGFFMHLIPNDTRLHNASPRLHDDAWGILQSLSQAERDQIRIAQSRVSGQLLKVPTLVRSVR